MRNSEHYPDPTAGRAAHNIEHDEYKNTLGRPRIEPSDGSIFTL